MPHGIRKLPDHLAQKALDPKSEDMNDVRAVEDRYLGAKRRQG